jgi:transcriptional regulator with PAS, ATPase and Fis domain
MTNAASMQHVLEIATRAAATDTTVLITGESGVGKERLAKHIHQGSRRSSRPLSVVNCGSLPETLSDSELFGHVRGAFTGALQDHAGIFETADRGTLFLDEVGDIPLPVQVKLLRALQHGEVRRVGESRSRRVDVRLIAATNRNLRRDVQSGRFREDLFYRLTVIEICIPPLRDRGDEFERLLTDIVRLKSHTTRRRITGWTSRAFEYLRRYPWPGNIRELENVIERACVLSTGRLIDIPQLPHELRQLPRCSFSPASEDSVLPLWDVEREHIMAVLHRNGGNQTRTARELRIAPSTLARKLKTYARTA